MLRLPILITILACIQAAGPVEVVMGQDGDQARQLAESTIEQMGGMDRWNDQQFLVWDIFGETHYWDKWSGDFRWESDSLLVLMNIKSRTGRVWVDGEEVPDGEQKAQILDRAYARWINNSYWVIMPFKLLDPGVNLTYVGMDTSMAGQITDVIELTFDNVGLTPENKYHVYIDRESGMVCQWGYYESREDPEPSIVTPWNEWKDYDGVWMSTGRGSEGRAVSRVSLPENLPRSVFEDPGPVSLD
jgi:hypothetical protein